MKTTGFIISETMEKYNHIKVKLKDPKAKPLRAHPTDAGADLFSAHNSFLLYPGDKALVDTGVALKIPAGYVGLVFNRSSQGKIEVSIPHAVGVIDAAYRGNIKVLLKNNGEDPYEIHPYTTRIAQLVIVPVMLPTFSEYDSAHEEWDDTERGTGGFGSTNLIKG